jgi:hypothetical protein
MATSMEGHESSWSSIYFGRLFSKRIRKNTPKVEGISVTPKSA